MLARVAFMKALNSNVVLAFKSDAKKRGSAVGWAELPLIERYVKLDCCALWLI